MYIYDEIPEFHVLELRMELNVYVPRSFFLRYLSSSEKANEIHVFCHIFRK